MSDTVSGRMALVIEVSQIGIQQYHKDEDWVPWYIQKSSFKSSLKYVTFFQKNARKIYWNLRVFYV